MNFDTLRKIYGKLAKNDNIKDVKTLNKCKKFLNDLPEPQDEIDRSYLQYLTQQYYPRNGILHFFEKIYSKIKLNKTISLFTENKPIFKDNADAVFYNPLGKKIVPQEVSSQYANIVIDDGTDNLLLLDKDCRFIAEIRKRYKDVFFIFKLVCKIAIYRNLIEKYKPKAIIATAEYSFCSSALTRFCRDNGVKHINIMHGEKLFDMRATFFEFDNCYIWDSFYEDLFLAQRAKAEQFIIALPESLKFSRHDVEQIIDLKVYLSDETKAELKVLKKKLDIIKITNPLNIKKICIRPHPIYTSLKRLKSCLEKITR